MARGHHGSPLASALPKVSFERVKDEFVESSVGVGNNQMKGFGYNDPQADFHRPDHYIRYIEPLESDLATTVEYDMDEQDQEWLDAVNADRKKEQVDTVSPEIFEIIIDRLEKEWFNLTKNLPKNDLAMPSEDSTCAICDDSEGENSNAIVFCDGCNLAVHQDCYGVPYIPEGQWLCRKCTVSPENPVECILCPNEGGAFKQTTHSEWLHLLCAIWIPETRVGNDVFMEPISGVEKIPKQRWKLRCSICDVRQGACIQCAKASCFLSFHATCARREKLLLPMKTAQGAEPVTLTCYCEKHLPNEQLEARAVALATDQSHGGTQLTPKSARAYAKTYKPGPPLVPAIVVSRISQYINKIHIRKKSEFVLMVCRYWSLKREARRGAPLLKRLHLEPWTSTTSKVQTEEQMQMQLQLLYQIRQDLRRVLELADLSRKRETRKLRQHDLLQQIVTECLFPHEVPIRIAFEKIASMDKNDWFKNPVSKDEVPDYFEVVKRPMCWTIIETKLDNHEYWDLQLFKDDVELVLRNALLYNAAGSNIHKVANRILNATPNIFEGLNKYKARHPPPPEPQMEDDDLLNFQDEVTSIENPPHVGDLEPPMEILDLLTSSDAIKEDLNMELDDGPLASMFNYSFARVKPQPPNSPAKPPPRSKKSKKRDRKAEAEKRKARAAASAQDGGLTAEEANEGDDAQRRRVKELQATLDMSAGFRAPRTRGPAAGSSYALDGDQQISAGSTGSEDMWNRSKKRIFTVPPGQSSAPRVVSDVGNRDSFSLFNAGWILPPDHKRGGRHPTERQSFAPPPKKKQKTDHHDSGLSAVSTAPSEIDQGQEIPDPSLEDAMKVDSSERRTKPRSQLKESISRGPSIIENDDIDAPHNVVTQPNGVVIIEKLDTPAIRRERNMRRKAERRKLAEEAANKPLSSVSVPENAGSANERSRFDESIPAGMQNEAEEERDGDESELSDLSESASQEKEGKEKSADASHVAQDSISSRVRNRPQKSASSSQGRRSGRTEVFLDGTLVWAKAESYPWWPAVVFKDDNEKIPVNVLEEHRRKKIKRKIKLYIVQFYDNKQSWQSVPREKLALLGEDFDFDQEMLGQKQKWKSNSVKHSCREAYDAAMADMDTSSTVQQGSSTAQPTDGEEA